MAFGTNKKDYTLYLLLLFFIMMSGGAMTYGMLHSWQLFLFPILLYIYYGEGKVKSVNGTWLLLSLSFIIIAQFLKFDGKLVNVILPVFTIVDAMVLACLLNKRFVDLYIRLIVLIATISLGFWVFDMLGGHSILLAISNLLPQLGLDNMKALEINSVNSNTLYFYQVSLDSNHVFRNSGPFWEPGLFSIYIVIALVINLFVNRQNICGYKNLILLFTAVTTFSTTCYVVLGVIACGLVLASSQNKLVKYIFVILMFFAIPAISDLDFMSDKIMLEFNSDTTYSRFGAIAYHLTLIQQSPIIGFGPFIQKITILESSPNGWSELIVYYGIPASLYLFYRIYKFSIRLCPIDFFNRMILFLSIIIVVFTQTQMHSPFYFLIYFLSFYPLYEYQK
ncbi:hypothetical protein NE636_22060 [Bacteroides thetaiotaomicron]|uniref:Uncharacterized protein n=1 Tax=Bacteroides thetaiotaomicron TaxID=818 RepID=A0AAW4Z9P3_BACT4|nr:hypothetical protein [Bacteroides thetaiotaomicron]MBV4310689.1 hypothetical protein [Bacteroides thetaiotaomicron]MBV4329573.1 hypothetical protein [Bacteroides thetaiotaomicron]MCB7385546.1 hypothetical protein [Bacteroides thetaiotaomicron]MCE9238162.1 hypothetical protein [Bacteroides thetaiotaomicron]MCE9267832.1 hypothetical protein [Bacteroides thetaiotaomicron]